MSPSSIMRACSRRPTRQKRSTTPRRRRWSWCHASTLRRECGSGDWTRTSSCAGPGLLARRFTLCYHQAPPRSCSSKVTTRKQWQMECSPMTLCGSSRGLAPELLDKVRSDAAAARLPRVAVSWQRALELPVLHQFWMQRRRLRPGLALQQRLAELRPGLLWRAQSNHAVGGVEAQRHGRAVLG